MIWIKMNRLFISVAISGINGNGWSQKGGLEEIRKQLGIPVSFDVRQTDIGG